MAVVIAVLIVFADQISKYYIGETMTLGTSIPVIPNVFHITYVLNPGAAFGIMENQTFFFIGIAVALLVGSVYFFRSIPARCRLLHWGIALMSGGAAGNLIDRIKTGLVVDFFDFRIWPVFNIADIAIVSGVAGLIATMMISSRHRPAEK